MKKLAMKAFELGATEILGKEHLKHLMGGSAPAQGGSCAVYLPSSSANLVGNVSGSSLYVNNTTNVQILYNTSSATAQANANAYGAGAKWCCSSCSSASWYQQIPV